MMIFVAYDWTHFEMFNWNPIWKFVFIMTYNRTAPFGRCFRFIWFEMNSSFVLIQTTFVRGIMITKSTLIPMIHNEFRMLQPHMFVLGAKGLCFVIKIECTECIIAYRTLFNPFIIQVRKWFFNDFFRNFEVFSIFFGNWILVLISRLKNKNFTF